MTELPQNPWVVSVCQKSRLKAFATCTLHQFMVSLSRLLVLDQWRMIPKNSTTDIQTTEIVDLRTRKSAMNEFPLKFHFFDLVFFTSHATSLPPPGDDWGRSWFFPSSENQNLALLPGLEGSHGWKKMTTKIGRFSDESHGSPRTTHESWFSLKLMGVSLIVVKLPFNYPANFALVMGERIKDYDVPKSKSTKNIAKTCKDSICCSPCCWQSLPAAWLNFRIQGPFSCIILSIIANGTGSILRMLLQDGPLPCYK